MTRSGTGSTGLVVPDTSAWVEFLRGTGSPAHRTLTALLHQPGRIAVTEVVAMEVLAGARTTARLSELRSLMRSFRMLPLRGLADYERAASIYLTCRAGGSSIRRMPDCLIAVPAIRADASVLHIDRDFDTIAQHTPLRIEPLR